MMMMMMILSLQLIAQLMSYLFDSSDRRAESVPSGQKNRYLQSTNAIKLQYQ